MPNTPIPFIKGRRLGLSLPRRFVIDLLHFAKKVPSVPMERRMQLAEVVKARASATERVSWCAIFLKAYAVVASRNPELRRAYISFPFPHIYEHPFNVASFTLEREYQGELGVFFARVFRPEELSLRQLDQLVKIHKKSEIKKIDSYRAALLLSRFPRPIRRFIWWLGLCTDGPQRARHFGTFAISVVASLGAASLYILSPLTTTLNYSVFDDEGGIDVRITYDHRVMDGGTVARAIVELEKVLLGEIAQELWDESSEESELAEAATIALRAPERSSKLAV